MSDKTYIVERRKILAISPAPVDLVGVWNNDDGTIFTAPVDCLALVEVSEANYRAGKRISDWKVSEYGPSIEPYQDSDIGFSSMVEDKNFVSTVRCIEDREQLNALKANAMAEYQRRQAEKLKS